jgi:GT2 family glycosyltransferase
MNISVVIPAYKKTDQLLKNLETNMPFFKDCEVVVVNDDPETSMAPVKEKFPSIIIVQNAKNLGFAGAVNAGIQAATASHIFLLNSDVVLHDANYRSALSHFEKEMSLFAVGFAQQEKDSRTVGKNTFRWEEGFVQHSKAADMKTGITAWAEGGASLFDKAKLIELGMFDDIYSPFYWEDTDLGYRAWKHGFTILFDESVTVEHHHESTISSFFSQSKIKTIAYRNQFFFVWTNITDTDLISQHKSTLPGWLIRMLLKGEFAFINGFIQAYSQLEKVKKMRSQKRLLAKKTDKEILNTFSPKSI